MSGSGWVNIFSAKMVILNFKFRSTTVVVSYFYVMLHCISLLYLLHVSLYAEVRMH